MKKLTLSLLSVAAVASTSFAGTIVSTKEYKQPVVTPCFKDTEAAFDLFYSFNDGYNTGGREHYLRDGSGGGAAFTVFFARYFGLGIEGNWWNGALSPNNNPDNDKDVVHQVTGQLTLRYPFEGAFCWAPYTFLGGGGIFDGSAAGLGNAGAGVEFRVTPNIGIFTDWRYNWTAGGANYFSNSRAGLRFVF